MSKQTVLHQQHLDAGAKMIDFAGWDMPLHYGSQLVEHQAVREKAGVFDTSHMGVIDISGPEAEAFLSYLLSNDITRLDEPGKAQYTLMLNERGGVLDDFIVYRIAKGYRLIVNSAMRDSDLTWIQLHGADRQVEITPRPTLAILAVQGPDAIEQVCSLLPAEQSAAVQALGNFRSIELGDWLFARTGYTGEKGLELIMPGTEAVTFWVELMKAGVQPVGLGARDTLRLEAGMNLYGQDMDENTSPLAANLEQVIAWQPEERNFIGREAVTEHKRQQAAGTLPCLVGVVLEARGVPREGQQVLTDKGEGILTSGCFSPSLKQGIGLARIPCQASECRVVIRNKEVAARIVKPGFVRGGRSIIT